MLKYILRRILIFIPTLIIISLLAFVISVNAPGDPVERMVVAAQSGGEVSTQSANQLEQKKFWRNKLGLDLPIFYLSLSNYATPDTLYKIFDKNEKNALERLIKKYGNWSSIAAYYNSLTVLSNQNEKIVLDSTIYTSYSPNEIKEALNQSKFESLSLLSTYDENVILSKFSALSKLYTKYSFFKEFTALLHHAEEDYKNIALSATSWKNYLPTVKIYTNNQYHRWIFGDGNWITGANSKYSKGIIRGDFGTSYTNKQAVSETISKKIGWSLFFTLISVFLAYLVSIPIGVKSAVKKGSRFDRVSTLVLFILYSMPSFFVATLLLMTFSNPDVIHWFPASGVEPVTGIPEHAGFFEALKLRLPYLILPSICYTYSSFAFLSRTMRVSMLEIVGNDYIRTARAKGLSESVVIYKHALRNALLPIITVFANIFPLAIGGSVILETIFTIPGMGYEIFKAIQTQDYPMMIAVFTLTGILTLVGYLVSDVLYAIADPRISFSNK